MRKVAAAVLAFPVLVRLYLRLVLPRRRAARLAAALLIGAVTGADTLMLTATEPQAASATRTRPIAAIPAGALQTDVRTGQAPDASIRIRFTTPMHRESVRAALDVQPHAAIRVDWNADSTVLTVAPLRRWASGTYYTITVRPGALAATGAPLAVPVRAVFLTRPVTSAAMAATGVVGDRMRTDATFSVDFSGPVDPATVPGAFLIEPAVAGSWAPVDAGDARVRYAFTPLGSLAADTVYRVRLSSTLRDGDGGPVQSSELEVRTVIAPDVVRFRPVDGSSGVSRAAALSVRFSQSMDRATTAAAFSATVAGKPLAGAMSWAENDTVLVFRPVARLGYEETVVLTVTGGATSTTGGAMVGRASATFTTESRPPPPPPPAAAGGTNSGGSTAAGSSAGATAASGSWTAVEAYYLKLMNCTRTGGLVTSSGACSSPGGRNVAPLKLDAGISATVARPYARLLATGNLCSHFVGGNPGDRLRRAGYAASAWAENLGCRSGDPYGAVLASHLFFQSERSWSPPGGHYTNLMSTKFDRVGIGVWVSSGRVRLVVDFYHP
ncbi:MAG TPA: Ig-like domain-containing protein [Vitreimonas sp.]|nr:Ig-like domain-containing protein [Vitreimonas sp.]